MFWRRVLDVLEAQILLKVISCHESNEERSFPILSTISNHRFSSQEEHGVLYLLSLLPRSVLAVGYFPRIRAEYNSLEVQAEFLPHD